MRCECGACVCHTLGILLLVACFGLVGLGIACVVIFSPEILWYKLGLGAFGVGSLFGLLLVGYVCFVMSRGWRMFGCCGGVGDSRRERRKLRKKAELAYETKINTLSKNGTLNSKSGTLKSERNGGSTVRSNPNSYGTHTFNSIGSGSMNVGAGTGNVNAMGSGSLNSNTMGSGIHIMPSNTVGSLNSNPAGSNIGNMPSADTRNSLNSNPIGSEIGIAPSIGSGTMNSQTGSVTSNALSAGVVYNNISDADTMELQSHDTNTMDSNYTYTNTMDTMTTATMDTGTMDTATMDSTNTNSRRYIKSNNGAKRWPYDKKKREMPRPPKRSKAKEKPKEKPKQKSKKTKKKESDYGTVEPTAYTMPDDDGLLDVSDVIGMV